MLGTGIGGDTGVFAFGCIGSHRLQMPFVGWLACGAFLAEVFRLWLGLVAPSCFAKQGTRIWGASRSLRVELRAGLGRCKLPLFLDAAALSLRFGSVEGLANQSNVC